MQPIILLTHEFFPVRGGVGIYVHELAKAAARIGYDVKVLAPEHPTWHQYDLGVEVQALSTAPLLNSLWLFPETARYLIANRRILRHQTLHICQQGPLRVMMVLRFLGVVQPKSLIVTLHGSELLQLRSSLLGGKQLFQNLLENADRIAVLSRWVRDELTRTFPSVLGKTVVAPGAPRSNGPPSPEHARKRNSRITLLTVGRIDPRKGQHTILKALARLDPAHQDRVRYCVVGPVVNRGYMKSLSQLARSTAVEVTFTGQVDDETLHRHYAEADIFALTSEHQRKSVEGFGLAYLEASAYGLPILAHRTGGVEDTVKHGITGFLIEEGDNAGLDSALLKLIENTATRKQLGANGRKWAAMFSWDNCARAVYGGLD